MNDREGFISRWARRKAEAAKREDRLPPQADMSAAQAADAPEIEEEARNAMREGAHADGAAPGDFTVDLSKLPSIESISAQTDIRPFLVRGVPSALRQAALRKLWVADPAIRDFVEVAENQWDFNAPDGILGFDLSPPVGDVKRMVAEILGSPSGSESEPTGAAVSEQIAGAPAVVSDAAVSDGAGNASPPGEASHPLSIRQTRVEGPTAIVADQPDRVAEPTENIASQNNIATQQPNPATPKRRSHGRAMPH